MKMRQVAGFLAAAVLFAACGGERPASQGGATASDRPLTIKGSDTMVILGQRLAEEYMKKNPGAVVQVNGGGSGTGIAALINGTVDLAQSSREMKGDEREKVQQNRGAAVVEKPVALDALAVFVNEKNTVRTLTTEQLKKIFRGEVRNWREIGGGDAPIVLYGRENSSGTYDYFREHVLDKEDFAPAVQTLQGTAAVINAVGRDLNGIGYGGIAYAKEVRPVGVSHDGKAPVEPGEETVADGSYPLARKLFFYHLEGAPPRVQEFVRFALSAEGQALVVDVGYFPLTTAQEMGSETATSTSGEQKAGAPANAGS